MGQQEVIDFLNKKYRSRKWWTSKEIAENMEANLGSITMSLKKLRNSNFILYRSAARGQRERYEYRSKKRANMN